LASEKEFQDPRLSTVNTGSLLPSGISDVKSKADLLRALHNETFKKKMQNIFCRLVAEMSLKKLVYQN
jgi:hypothetical protein